MTDAPTDLPQRLGALADLGTVDATAPGPGDAAAAWQRGVRYRRRQRLGTATIAAMTVALLTGIAGFSAVRGESTIQPAGSQAPAGLPNRFYAPSTWLPSTSDDHPLGQLAALVPAERGSWWGTDEGLVGISATTGEYRFLDLPDWAEGSALSPDGRQVAYWTTGPTTGTPNTSGGQALAVSGVALYDTVTGEVRRAAIKTEHGLATDGLLWADNTTLLLGHGQYMVGDEAEGTPLGTGQSNGHRWYVWAAEDAAPAATEALRTGQGVEDATGPYVLLEARRTKIVNLADGSRRRVSYNPPLAQITALDPTGTRVAFPGNGGANNRTPNRIQVNGVDGSTSVVPDSQGTLAVLAWTDATRVAVLATTAPRRSFDTLQVDLVNIGDGTRTTVLETHGVGSNSFQLATDLLGGPTVAAARPPQPLDPRWVTGGLVAILLAGSFSLIRWRRRVQP